MSVTIITVLIIISINCSAHMQLADCCAAEEINFDSKHRQGFVCSSQHSCLLWGPPGLSFMPVMGVQREANYEGGGVRKVHCSKGSQAVPARPSVEMCYRQGVSVMTSELMGCAEGKRIGHWSSVLFVFGGQRYGDSLVPSGGLRCGRKFCVW